MRKRVFISYSHKDKTFFDKLKTHLGPLERAGIIDLWDDTKIQPGQRWLNEIKSGLQDVQIAILLVSANFANSNFIVGSELPKILSDEVEKGLRVFWIPISSVSDTTLKLLQLDQFQAAYTPPEPLDKMTRAIQHSKLAKVIDDISKLVTLPTPPTGSASGGSSSGGETSKPVNNSFGSNTSGFQNALLLEHADHVPQRPDGNLLFGRNDILQQLSNLEIGWRVLLHGFPGEGKTAIAATFAMSWLEKRNESVIWLKAGNAEFELLLESVARVVGITESMRENDNFKLEQAVNNALRTSNITAFVIDDSWNSNSLRKLMEVIPSKTCVLVTSRDLFSPVTITIEIGKLKAPFDIDLLRHIAGEYLKDNNVGQDICNVLSSHAFSIRLAGYLMRQTKWSGEVFLSKYAANPLALEAPRGLLEDGRKDVSALIQTSLSALQMSKEEIDRQASEVFMILGAYAAPIYTPQLIELYSVNDPPLTGDERKLLNRVKKHLGDTKADNGRDELTTKHWMEINIDHKAVESKLDILVQWGLISVQRDIPQISVYRLHDLAFAFVSSRATVKQKLTALKALYNYTRHYSAPLPENFDALEPLLPHLSAAIISASSMKQEKLVQGMVNCLYNGSQGIGHILTRQMHYGLSEQLLSLAVESAIRKRDKQGQTVWLGNLGELYVSIGKAEQSITTTKQALAISEATDDKRNQSVQLGILAKAYQRRREYSISHNYHLQAIKIASSIEEWGIVSNQYNNLGTLFEHMKDYNQAMKYFQKALDISTQRGDEFFSALNRGNIGRIHSILGKPDIGKEMIEDSLNIARKYGDRHREAELLNNLGDIYFTAKQFDEAKNHWKQAASLYRSAGRLDIANVIEDKIRTLR